LISLVSHIKEFHLGEGSWCWLFYLIITAKSFGQFDVMLKLERRGTIKLLPVYVIHVENQESVGTCKKKREKQKQKTELRVSDHQSLSCCCSHF
jgi:hypothetical protein